jgi:DNA mismatch repair protein MutL
MARIQKLPSTLINQIAAGEVVERPASVVKELLDNAVDAGSTRIEVEAAQGGIDRIQVVDNGCGIAAEDLPLAFASHATSKLASVEDLCHIGTLGFRGEALASVGSIAQVRLQSRPAGQPCGAEVTCHGGQLGPVVPWNGSPGTRIEVRHLFYSTPARRKFLKSTGTEMGHVGEVFTRLALANPGLHGTLRHNGRLVHEVPGSVGLLDRIGIFFGSEVRNSLYQVEAGQGPLNLGGYVGDPSCDQGGTQLQYLFVNGRWVRDRGLFQAVQEAYRGLLMTGRYPVAFLFLRLPPEQVDVNVHPAKAEVRFRDREALYQFVHSAVRDRLREADLTARIQMRTRKEFLPQSGAEERFPVRPATVVPTAEERSPSAGPTEQPTEQPAATTSAASPQAPTALPRSSAAAPGVAPPSPSPASADLFPSAGSKGQPAQSHCQGRQEGSSTPSPPRTANVPRALQVLGCYLVVEVPPDEVLFIDQHALHERILFEQLQARFRSGSVEIQRLLIPEPVSLPGPRAALVLEHRGELAELGLTVEDFGGGTVLLTGYPALLGKRAPKAILQAVAEHLASKERAPNREQLLNDLLSLMACHAAVRAGDRLTLEDIALLLAQRELAQDSHHCPHGRPTALRFSRHDLERLFKRV